LSERGKLITWFVKGELIFDKGFLTVVHTFSFFNQESHLLAFLLSISHIMAKLGFLVLDVCWPAMIVRRLTMAVVGVIKLAMIFAIGLWLLDFFTMWLPVGNVPI
jgi:hypothetical protein